jgi:hypothetical protein
LPIANCRFPIVPRPTLRKSLVGQNWQLEIGNWK